MLFVVDENVTVQKINAVIAFHRQNIISYLCVWVVKCIVGMFFVIACSSLVRLGYYTI